MKYEKRPGDLKYRIVNVKTSEMPVYRDFSEAQINVPVEQVLEVLRQDGSEELFYDAAPKSMIYSRDYTEGMLVLPASLPTARVWVRRENGTGIAYKIPSNLGVQGAAPRVHIPGGVQNVILEGDKYAQKVYDIHCIG